MLYAGVDHHTKTSHITLINEKGTVIQKKSLPSDEQSVKEMLLRIRRAHQGYPGGKLQLGKDV